MFDSGVLYICDKQDMSEKGNAPKEVLTRRNKYWFERRMIGINRQYLAKGVNEKIDLLVRIPGAQKVSIGQFVELGNGDQYRINNVSIGNEDFSYTRMVQQKYYKTARIVGLDYTELTLSKLERNYELEITENKGCAC